jgi:hypothetical protein
MSTVAGLQFILTLLFAPENGVIIRKLRKNEIMNFKL